MNEKIESGFESGEISDPDDQVFAVKSGSRSNHTGEIGCCKIGVKCVVTAGRDCRTTIEAHMKQNDIAARALMRNSIQRIARPVLPHTTLIYADWIYGDEVVFWGKFQRMATASSSTEHDWYFLARSISKIVVSLT